LRPVPQCPSLPECLDAEVSCGRSVRKPTIYRPTAVVHLSSMSPSDHFSNVTKTDFKTKRSGFEPCSISTVFRLLMNKITLQLKLLNSVCRLLLNLIKIYF